ncbi:MAG: hypothetical protein FWE40_01395 [Oscillospiraceae bacterium]|nr:hypothetical protein [Oscillospiraceae bacterium]
MKRNVFLRAAAAIMVCCIATLCLLPSTLARYTQSITPANNATVRAGIFHVLANDEDFTARSITTIGRTYNFGTLLQQPGPWTTEQHVVPNNGSVIAPGTGGYFELIFENQSEVPVRFRMHNAAPSGWFRIGSPPTMQEEGRGIIEFALSSAGPWDGLLATLGSMTPQVLDPGETGTPIQIYWRWPFASGAHAANAVHPDTALGRSAARNPENPPGLEVVLQFIAEQLEA